MPSELQIVNARVYDPENNIDGEVKNIYVKDGKIVDSVSNSAGLALIRRRSHCCGRTRTGKRA